MIEQGVGPLERRVLILAPTAKDAAASVAILGGAGVAGSICRDVEGLCAEARRGAAAAILTEEALMADRTGCLAALSRDQPPWSDLPLIVLTAAGVDSPRIVAAAHAAGNTTLVKRPVQVSTLVSTVAFALRDRDRQYQARDHLVERERQAALLREAGDSLAFALEAGRLGSWQLDLATGDLPCTAICKANLGLPPEATLTHEALFALIHPDDRGPVRRALDRALERGEEYNAEYRNIWPDGSTHWIHVRGRASHDASGKPTGMAGISLDITERKQAEEALNQSIALLRDADRRKDEFLAMLAHELRNPLSAISNALQLAKRSRDQAHLDWGHEVIGKQIKHLSRMIDDLLDVSRVTRGKGGLRKETLAIASVIDSAIDTARPLIEGKGHTLSVDVDARPIRVDGDPTRLEQVFVNLLNNAAKYTPPGGRIAIHAEGSAGRVVVRIKDTGIGMTPEFLGRAFDLFTQVDGSIARTDGGLGIGLTLVKSLVEMHGGTIAAASDGLGMGSTFTISLPLSESIPIDDVPGGESPPQAVPAGSRALVVDDNVDTARGMFQLLKLLGNDATVVHDGLSAIAEARNRRPDVILLDIGLPDIDGYQVARTLREEGLIGTLIICVTGYGQDEDRERSRAAGIDHHLVKPLDVDSLIALLGKSR